MQIPHRDAAKHQNPSKPLKISHTFLSLLERAPKYARLRGNGCGHRPKQPNLINPSRKSPNLITNEDSDLENRTGRMKTPESSKFAGRD